MSNIQVGDFVLTDKALNAEERDLSGFVTSVNPDNGVYVDTSKGALCFGPHSITKIAIGDTVLVRDPLYPSWNGEAVVNGFSYGMISVRPVDGPNQGIDGAFSPSKISTLIPEPEPVEEPVEEPSFDGLRELAGALEVHAALVSEAAAYAIALADTLDTIKENALV